MPDHPESQISADTFLSSSPGQEAATRRVTDCALSRLLEVATILLWHGIWSLTDWTAKFYLCNSAYCLDSAVLSLIIGWTGGGLLFVFQFPLLHLSQHRHRSKLRLILFNGLNFVFTLAGVYFTINRSSSQPIHIIIYFQ